MKVLVFSSHILWQTHYETELEIIQNHLDNGDRVMHLFCPQTLTYCDLNFANDQNICTECMERRIYGQSLLTGKVDNIRLPKLKSTNEINELKFKDSNELKNYKIESFEIGMAVASTLISYSRDPEFDVIAYRKLINSLINNGTQLYYYFKQLIIKHKPDRIYIFNGRFIYVKAFVSACKKLNANFYVHERGSTISKYMLYHKNVTHNIEYINSLITRYWEDEKTSIEKKLEIGIKFFEERINEIEQGWYSFIKNQDKNKLPDNFDYNKKNIVIFNSSEDELAAISNEWNMGYYKSQIEGIRDIVSIIKNSDENNHLYIRMHPNLSNVDNKNVRELLNLSDKKLSVIKPSDDISTYNLMRNANLIIVFGSTTGIEATYLGKPAILIGSSYYMNLDATYNPKKREEFIELLKEDLSPKSKENALKYGYYMRSFGIDFKYYKATGIGSGTFKGKHVYSPVINKKSLNFLKKLLNKKIISEKLYKKIYYYLLRHVY